MKVGVIYDEIQSCDEITGKIKKQQTLTCVDLEKILSLLYSYKNRLKDLNVQED